MKKPNLHFLFALMLLFFFSNMLVCQTRYVQSVSAFSSDGNSPACLWGGWGVSNLTGAPDKYPAYGDDSFTAWAHCPADSSREFLELQFANPAPIDSITIYETFNPGAIDTVYVKDNNGNWQIVYSAVATTLTNPSAIARGISVPTTSYNVSELRIALDANQYPGSWSQIDAVAIHRTVLVSSMSIQGQAGDSTITTQSGTLQMETNILPKNATDSSVSWTVVNHSGQALISKSGILVALANGTVEVIATANDGSGIVSSKMIAISGQAAGAVSTQLNSANSLIKDSYVFSFLHFANINFGDSTVFNGGANNVIRVAADNWGPSTDMMRGLLKFDLSSLPVGATLLNAKLSLFYHGTSSSIQTGNNSFLIQRVNQSWNETQVTWNNQPTASTNNQVSVAASTRPDQDYEYIDVTNLVLDMLANPGNSDGFLLKMQNEVATKHLIFASSEHAEVAKHPTLLITYLPMSVSLENQFLNESALTVYPNPVNDNPKLRIVSNKNYETQIEVLDMIGKKQSEFIFKTIKSGVNEIDLNLEHLSKGVYLIRVSSANGESVSTSFVK